MRVLQGTSLHSAGAMTHHKDNPSCFPAANQKVYTSSTHHLHHIRSKKIRNLQKTRNESNKSSGANRESSQDTRTANKVQHSHRVYKDRNALPREALLNIVQISLRLPLPTNATNIITQASIAANKNTHRANLVLNFHTNKSIDIWSTREHLHSRRRALDFLGIAGTRYEQHNAQHFTSTVHG